MRKFIISMALMTGAAMAAAGQGYEAPVFVSPADSTAAVAGMTVEEAGYRMTWVLEDRDLVGRPEPIRYSPVQSGDVAVEIKVNRYGEVSLVSLQDRGTTLIDRELIDYVCEDAMNTLFTESGTAPYFQKGMMYYHFTVETPLPSRDSVAVVVDDWPVGPEAPSVVESIPEEDHLEFKKVKIDGPLPDFMNAMRETGLTYKGIRDDVGFLDGSFAGVAGSRIFAFSSGGKTYKVVVDFPATDSWPAVKKQYRYFKSSYSSKYFVTPRSTERLAAWYPENSGREFMGFREESATYASVFTVPNGRIVLSIQPDVMGEGKLFVRLEYIDDKNSRAQENAALDDI